MAVSELPLLIMWVLVYLICVVPHKSVKYTALAGVWYTTLCKLNCSAVESVVMLLIYK